MGLALVKPDGSNEMIDYPKGPRYRPKRGHILVRKLDRPFINGLHLPDNMSKSLVEGCVVTVGLPRVFDNGATVPIDVKVGDVVLYSEPAGLVIDLSDRTMHMLHEENVLAVKIESDE